MNANAFATTVFLSLALTAADSTAHAAGPSPAASGDLARLQGCWEAKAGARRELKVGLEIEGRAVRVRIVTPQGLTIRARGELRLDETSEPRALDWVNFRVADQEAFPDVPAIYSLRGETLTICNGGPNGQRPGAFEPGDGVLADVVTFARAPGAQGGRP
jgi:uncharacterized protein (TIGR03067 family)